MDRLFFSFLLIFIIGVGNSLADSNLFTINNKTKGLLTIFVKDKIILKSKRLDKNVISYECASEDNSLKLIEKRFVSSSSRYECEFVAIKPGISIITEKIVLFSKDKQKVEKNKFKVKVIDKNFIPKVTIKELDDNIKEYKGKFVRLNGINRRWGVTNKRVYGFMMTRSDSIFEDETGAAYISNIPNSPTNEPISLICKVIELPNGRWALRPCYLK